MRKLFNLQAWLKDKSQKVETRDGRSVRLICTDVKAKDGACVIALITNDDGEEAYRLFPNGRAFPSESPIEDCTDLFIITPEQELTEWEKAIKDLCWEVGMGVVVYKDDLIKKAAADLLDLARKEIDEEIPEMEFTPIEETLEYKAGFRAGKEETFKELSEKEESPAIIEARSFNAGRKQGQAEALKNLPRWKVSNAMPSTMPTVMCGDNGMILYKDGFEISISELEKLPKED